MEYNDDGLTALIFTSEGDMRQAINNLQSTHSGFGFVSGENVFKVCDQPHPVIVQSILRACIKGDIDGAMAKLNELWEQGYSAVDIVVTVFRVTKTFDEYVPQRLPERCLIPFIRLPEYTKLEYIKVRMTFLQLFMTLTRFRKSDLHTCGYSKVLGPSFSLAALWLGYASL